ncbi:MAG: hypothetical protein WD294_03360 [Phycisphaeraceae bacterium]
MTYYLRDKALGLAVLVTFVMTAAPTFAEDAAPSQTSVERLVAQLADADYDTREQATRALMAYEPLTEEQLTTALGEAEIPEQVHRLRQVAMHRYYHDLNPIDAPLDRGRGGLGIDLGERGMERVLKADDFSELDGPAVLLTETVPGFPAFVHLHAGDMVIGLDGARFASDLTVERFRDYLAEYEAGEEMTLHIVRNGELVDVTLTLDNVARIDSVHRVYSAVREPGLYRPFVDYMERLTPADRYVSTITISQD